MNMQTKNYYISLNIRWLQILGDSIFPTEVFRGNTDKETQMQAVN